MSEILRALYQGRRADAEQLAAAAPGLDVFEAAALGHDARVAELVDAEPGLVVAWTDDGFTALHLAAYFGGLESARVLLERGADVGAEARNEELAHGVTPLHSAAAARQLELARLLLDHGADPNARSPQGHTPLEAALANEDDDLAALLHERGAEAAA